VGAAGQGEDPTERDEVETRRVLVVDDDGPSRDLMRQFLEREGWTVSEAPDGPAALRAATETAIDVIVLDLGLPGLDGLDVLKAIRRASGVPVIVVTGRDEEGDKLSGFDAGADDYVVKPYSLPELGARVRAVLRRGAPAPAAEQLEFDGLVIDLEGARVSLDGAEVVLTRKEFALLAFLAATPGRCIGREELLNHVWGSVSDWQDTATVTEHIRRLRKKIDPDPEHPRFVETVRGHGYRFLATESTAVDRA
jgi:DNA-binding response OmpR family regulator